MHCGSALFSGHEAQLDEPEPQSAAGLEGARNGLDGAGGKRKRDNATDAISGGPEGCVFFVGGSVWALDVGAPIVGGSCDGGVYAALAPSPRGREETALGARLDGSCAIQIWQLVAPQSGGSGSEGPEQAVTLSPELSMLIPTSSALIHALALSLIHI